MSHLTTCEDSRSATSLPELASGLIPCGSPDGLTINQSGQAPARASLSARQAKVMGLLTSGTFGPTSSTSSASAGLSMSLANRLQAVTQTHGSTLYKLTWKEWNTPSGLCRLRQRASVLRTSGSGPTGWPTPTARSTTGAGTSGANGWDEHSDGSHFNGMAYANHRIGDEGETICSGRDAVLHGSSVSRLANTTGQLHHQCNDGTDEFGWSRNPEQNRLGSEPVRALEVNGFWRDADWLLCRDGKWRPVEPGTFPLVDGAAARLGRVESGVARVASSNRVGRLKGYGNAINAQAAAEFVRAYMEGL